MARRRDIPAPESPVTRSESITWAVEETYIYVLPRRMENSPGDISPGTANLIDQSKNNTLYSEPTTMTAPHTTIALLGLGVFASKVANLPSLKGVDPDQVQEVVDNQVLKARQAGFALSTINIDPTTHGAAILELRDALKDQHFDGFLLGFGLRAAKELTGLFEDVVNTCREVSPSTKLGFPQTPDGVLAAAERVRVSAK